MLAPRYLLFPFKDADCPQVRCLPLGLGWLSSVFSSNLTFASPAPPPDFHPSHSNDTPSTIVLDSNKIHATIHMLVPVPHSSLFPSSVLSASGAYPDPLGVFNSPFSPATPVPSFHP